MNDYDIGRRLKFPDGDTAVIIDNVFHKDEEDDKGVYDAIQVIFIIEGDEDRKTFDEILDSREGYKFNVMKPIN